jgi:hypothetical protein
MKLETMSRQELEKAYIDAIAEKESWEKSTELWSREAQGWRALCEDAIDKLKKLLADVNEIIEGKENEGGDDVESVHKVSDLRS